MNVTNAGIYVNGGNPGISNNQIINNSNITGIRVDAGNPAINDNVLSCNTIDLLNYTSNTINAQNNSWDHVPPTSILYFDYYCLNAGEDICSPIEGSGVDSTGAQLAPSPCL